MFAKIVSSQALAEYKYVGYRNENDLMKRMILEEEKKSGCEHMPLEISYNKI